MEGLNKEIKRGDVFYIETDDFKTYFPNEQFGERPAVIIQNNIGNIYSPTVIVAYLTSQKKKYLPTHVFTKETPCWSTILCEQVATISKQRLGRFLCRLSEDDMARVDRAVLISLGL